MGQPYSRQAAIGRVLGSDGGMEEGEMGGQLGRQAVVVGENHLQAETISRLQGLDGGHSVVHGDQQADLLGRQSLHHGRIEPVAILHAAGDRWMGHGSEPLQHAHQQGRAGHPIRVVITADRHRLALATGPLQPLNSSSQIGKVPQSIGGRLGLQQLPQLLRVLVPPASQNRKNLRGQPSGGAGLRLRPGRRQGGGQLPVLLGGGVEQR